MTKSNAVKTTSPSADALTVVLAYVFFAGMWILLSDHALGLLIHDPADMIKFSMVKGWFFVAVTTLLLFWLVRGFNIRQQDTLRRELDALRARQHSFDLLSAIVDNSDDAIFAKDRDGRYLLFNNAASRFVGKSSSEAIGQDDHALFPPEQAAMLMAIDQRIIASGDAESNEEVLDTALGRRMFLTTKGPLFDAGKQVFGTFGISRDVTERIRNELALRESERRFHDIVDSSADWIWEVDAAERYTYASAGVQSLLGYTPAEVLGKTPFDFMPPDEASRVRAELREITTRRASFRDLDNISAHKDGSLRHVMTSGIPILAPDGSLVGYRGLDRDITKRKQAEDTLRHLADDMDATLEAIPDLLFEIDAEGHYLDVKATHERLLAAPPDQLIGRKVTDVLPAEAAATVMAALAAAGNSGSDYGRTITLPLAHGPSHFEISVARKALVSGQAGRFIVLSRDITARSSVEEQLRLRNLELERFNRATIGRELDMLEMKKTINALSQELGRAPPYLLAFIDATEEKGKA